MVAIEIWSNRVEMVVDGSKNPFMIQVQSKLERVIGELVRDKTMKFCGVAHQHFQEMPDDLMTWELQEQHIDNPNSLAIYHQLKRIIADHLQQMVKMRDAFRHCGPHCTKQ